MEKLSGSEVLELNAMLSWRRAESVRKLMNGGRSAAAKLSYSSYIAHKRRKAGDCGVLSVQSSLLRSRTPYCVSLSWLMKCRLRRRTLLYM